LYDISDFIERTLVKMLKEFKEKTIGYPIDLTEEKWDEILDRMIFLLAEMNEDTCSMQYEYNENDSKEYERKKYIEIAEYRNKCKDEFYDLMKKHHWDLWW
jgi:hypothetical protein